MSDLLYKYTDYNGAQKILSSGTLRFSRPSALNDPFDVFIDDLFGMDLGEVFADAKLAILDSIQKNPELTSKVLNIDQKKTGALSNFLRDLPEEKINYLKKEIMEANFEELDPGFNNAMENLREMRNNFAERFRNYGIFCATKAYDNLLMWVHYADQHRGAVLGFRPDLDKDSFLRLMEPIKYSDERPHIFERTADWLNSVGAPASIELSKKVNQQLLHTKSVHWSYEEEYRLAIPAEVPDGQSHTLLKFHPNELEIIYLGSRMNEEAKGEISSLAKKLNPQVQIYSAKLAKRKYALEFERH